MTDEKQRTEPQEPDPESTREERTRDRPPRRMFLTEDADNPLIERGID